MMPEKDRAVLELLPQSLPRQPVSRIPAAELIHLRPKRRAWDLAQAGGWKWWGFFFAYHTPGSRGNVATILDQNGGNEPFGWWVQPLTILNLEKVVRKPSSKKWWWKRTSRDTSMGSVWNNRFNQFWPNGILFHQPRFPWNRGFHFPSSATFWWPRSCEVAIIWSDKWFNHTTIQDVWYHCEITFFLGNYYT